MKRYCKAKVDIGAIEDVRQFLISCLQDGVVSQEAVIKYLTDRFSKIELLTALMDYSDDDTLRELIDRFDLYNEAETIE